uniref:Uncharacterized protein MANES_04G071900 n=1 Tax=Rhizophora mucronata TaxID=61149 RepID=A0A2P2JDJ1_RHIMU
MGSEQDETISGVNWAATSSGDTNPLNQNGAVTNGLVHHLGINGEGNEVSKLDDVVGDSHNVPYIYRQDIVRHKMSGVIGIVNEVAGDTDSDSSTTDDYDDDSEEEDEDDGGDVNGDSDNNANNTGNSDKDNGNYKNERLQADQVRVIWMDDTEPIQYVNSIAVVDRGFLHGDYVASASDPTGQVGVVVDVNISVDLLAHDGSIVKDVSSRDLKRVREFAVGDYVVHGAWLGRVDDVLDNVTVLVDDGSVCKVMGAEPLRLKPISKNMFNEDEHFPYYPGQRVRAVSSSVFRNSRWLSGLWKHNRLEGTVTKVTTGSVFIYWIASAGYGPESSTAPPEEQSPKNLKPLSCFAHANWQVGDWCLLPPDIKASSVILDRGLSKLDLHDAIRNDLESSQPESGCDLEEVTPEDLDQNNVSMDIEPETAPYTATDCLPGSSSCASSKSVSKEGHHDIWPLHRKKIRKVVLRRDKKARKKEETFERALMIVNTRTKVDVVWQDGTTEHGLDSTKLIPIDSPGDHEFVAEQYVVEKASDDVDNNSEARRVGVVKGVNAKERTACVRWLKPVSRAEDLREFDKEEIVSVYELEGHPDYDYSYGDVVVRLTPVSISSKMTSDGESGAKPKQQTEEDDIANAKKGTGFKKAGDTSWDEASIDFSDLSWVGNITGLKNGDIEVTWADGMVSMVGPQAIFVVGRDDDDSAAAGSEVSDDAASWETVSGDDMSALENTQEEVGLLNATDTNSEEEGGLESDNSGRNPALSLPLAALDFVTRLATGIFSRGQKNDPDFVESKGENELKGRISISEEKDSVDESSSQRSNIIDSSDLQSVYFKEEKDADLDAPVSSDAAACSANDSYLFNRFDLVQDPLDHHFCGSNVQANNGRKWAKKVQQEWNILQNNLPEGIYVRAYEDRMDLLRAVIVGAYGTPYQDGLFFFDFQLPPEYPDVPLVRHSDTETAFSSKATPLLHGCN